MTTPTTGYAIADLNALKAIPSSDRTLGYSLLVTFSSGSVSTAGKTSAWYSLATFPQFGANLPTADDINYVAPNDQQSSGELWVRHGQLDKSVFSWTTLTNGTSSYTAKNGDKLLLIPTSNQVITISLPSGSTSQIPEGFNIRLLSVSSDAYNPNSSLIMKILNWDAYSQAAGNTSAMTFTTTNTEVGIVYSSYGGWYSSLPNFFTQSN